MSGWAKPSSRPDNRLRPAKISAELLGRFSLRPLFPGGGTLTFHKTEALRPVRTERLNYAVLRNQKCSNMPHGLFGKARRKSSAEPFTVTPSR